MSSLLSAHVPSVAYDRDGVASEVKAAVAKMKMQLCGCLGEHVLKVTRVRLSSC